MRILFITSEVAPFAKTGGLGDVSSALPRALRALGHDVRVVVPFYQRVRAGGGSFETVLPAVEGSFGTTRVRFRVLTAPLPQSDAPVLFIDCPGLYEREGIYTQDPDEHLRFAALGWAALKTCQYTGWAPDVVHVNDWQASLVPLMMRTLFGWDRLFERARTVLTIHNIGHQGSFPASVVPELGVSPGDLHQEQLGAGRVNFLLHGILYANAITTVSPTYAREIQTPEHGVGLDPFLRARQGVLFGILNGIDDDVWNPSKDPLIPFRYSAEDLRGKAGDKAALMEAMGLPHVPAAPVIGVVSRLTWQKGFDLCAEVLPPLLARRPVQLVVLGRGEPRYHGLFASLAARFPRQVAFRDAFSEALAHRIEAGADIFLMPSRYEPCGLNQMYSLAYGTVPVVHRTGGLADTVTPWDPRRGAGNGFWFERFDAAGLAGALGRALGAWERPAEWRRIQANGMAEDFSWGPRVRAYEALYRRLA